MLAFDEPERLKNPASVALLDFLLQRGPANLHLAFACREFPIGINLAAAALEGHAEIVTTDELRFSEAQVAEYFGAKLSRGELATVMADSAGWPFALRIARNETQDGAQGGARMMRDFVANWVESRLFDGLDPEDREFLLDIGLFEWIDAAPSTGGSPWPSCRACEAASRRQSLTFGTSSGRTPRAIATRP